MVTISPPLESAPERPAFEPFVPPERSPAELTLRAVILGAVLGVVFAGSSVYLALKIGLTVSASIPIAVLSVAFFRTLGRSTILENNIVAALVGPADAAQIPAADYLAHVVGLQGALGAFAQSDVMALLVFGGLGFVLYRVAAR